MEPKTEPQINKNTVDLEDWKSIISHPNFKKVRVYVNNRIKTLENALSFAIKNDKPSLDRSLQLEIFHAKKQELEQFISHIDIKVKQYFKHNKEGSNA